MDVRELVALGAVIIEVIGVGVIVLGAVAIPIWAMVQRGLAPEAKYRMVRQNLGRAILLGLELLVGADIIRTVSEVPTLRSVAVLAGIVLIRTFLSITLSVELEGRWPWQRAEPAAQ